MENIPLTHYATGEDELLLKPVHEEQADEARTASVYLESTPLELIPKDEYVLAVHDSAIVATGEDDVLAGGG